MNWLIDCFELAGFHCKMFASYSILCFVTLQMISLLPGRIMKLLEIVGFSGNKVRECVLFNTSAC